MQKYEQRTDWRNSLKLECCRKLRAAKLLESAFYFLSQTQHDFSCISPLAKGKRKTLYLRLTHLQCTRVLYDARAQRSAHGSYGTFRMFTENRLDAIADC